MTCLNFEYHFWSGYYYTSCLISYVLLLIHKWDLYLVSKDPVYFTLAGLNDTTAAGLLNGFALLQKFASGFSSTHSTALALSDRNNELLISNTETADEVFSNHFILCKSLDDIGELI